MDLRRLAPLQLFPLYLSSMLISAAQCTHCYGLHWVDPNLLFTLGEAVNVFYFWLTDKKAVHVQNMKLDRKTKGSLTSLWGFPLLMMKFTKSLKILDNLTPQNSKVEENRHGS